MLGVAIGVSPWFPGALGYSGRGTDPPVTLSETSHMAGDIPLALGGPVLWWEVSRMRRRIWSHLLYFGYLGWLFFQFLGFLATLPAIEARPSSYTPIEVARDRTLRRAAFCEDHAILLLRQQQWLLLFLTPIVTAGALGNEKEHGTLTALFATELKSRHIVIGKLLGRLAYFARPALLPLPIVVLLAGVGEVALHLLLFALAQTAVLVFALASACVLCAIWTRRTADAILASYSAVGLIVLLNLAVLADTPLPDWLDPVEAMQLVRLHPQSGYARFLLHLALWAGVGVVCLVVASYRLRPACLHQIEKRPGRWLWAFRPRVWDDSVRWRERYVIGLAPMPWLRGVPTWLALSGVFAFSAILAGSAIDALAPGFFKYLLKGEFAMAWERFRMPWGPERLGSEVSTMGVVLLLVGTLVVAVRSATSIAEEKRRKTWHDLLLTGHSPEEIARSKMWGVLLATIPYLIAYSLPMFFLSYLDGPGGLILPAFWVCLTGLLFYLVASKLTGVQPDSDIPMRVPRRPPLCNDREGPAAPITGAMPSDDGPLG